MKWLTDTAIRKPVLAILGLVVVTAFFGYEMRYLRMDPDITKALPPDLPARRLYDSLGTIFPSKEFIMVLYVPRDSLFTTSSIEHLDRLTKELEEFPELYKVMSPTNVKIIQATEDGMSVQVALASLPKTGGDIQVFRKRLFSNPLFVTSIVSRDRKSAGILLFLRTNADAKEFTRKLLAFLSAYQERTGETVTAVGKPVVNYYVSLGIAKDMKTFFTSGIVLMFLLLFVIFRSIRGIFIPLVIVLSSVIWSLGFMALVNAPLSHSTDMLPILLMAIGIADSIHLLTHYYQNASRFSSPAELMRHTMDHLRAPVILTSVTTAIGFLALNTSNMDSLEQLGMFSAFGVMVAMIWSLVFVPAILTLLKIKVHPRWKKERTPLKPAMTWYGARLVARRYGFLLSISAVVVISIFGISRLRVESSSIDNFPPDHPLWKATRIVNTSFAGAETFQVVIEGKEPGAIKDPLVLARMDSLERFVERIDKVGSATSIADMIKRMHQVMNNDAPEYFRVPAPVETVILPPAEGASRPDTIQVNGKDLVAQYLQLYEMSGSPDDFANFVDLGYQNAKITVFLRSDKGSVLTEVDTTLQRFIDEHFQGTNATITGMAKILLIVRNMVVRGQFMSIITSLVLIWLLTALLFRSPVLGLYCTAPLFFAVFLNFATMGLSGITLSIETMVTSSLAIGVGVDYAIHFIHAYREQVRKSGDLESAVLSTMGTTGTAIVFNSITVALGFAIMMLSTFKGVEHMGMLLGLTMITSAFGALTINPVLFLILKPRSIMKLIGPSSENHQERKESTP